jgi:hypothetical protein
MAHYWFVCVIPGVVKLVLGVVSLLITVPATVFIRAEGMSALRWSWWHIAGGFLGCTVIVGPVLLYDESEGFEAPPISGIYGVDSTKSAALLNSAWRWRTRAEWALALREVARQLDFWSLAVLLDPNYHSVRDSQHLTFMDAIAFYVPVLSFIPGLPRILIGIPATVLCGAFTLFVDSPRGPYWARWGFYLCVSGLLSCTLPWVNLALYQRREKIGRFDQQAVRTVPPSYGAGQNV